MESENTEGCSVRMFGSLPCRRPLYQTGSGADERPRCLMHSNDSAKNNHSFQEEFNRILKDAGDGWADFTSFVFPDSKYSHREFEANCCFNGAIFIQEAQFSQSTFLRDAHFCRVEFQKSTSFRSAKFVGDTLFGDAKFRQWVTFASATFIKLAHFPDARFFDQADFLFTVFAGGANFWLTRCKKTIDFREAAFVDAANFDFMHLDSDANFVKAAFQGPLRVEKINPHSDVPPRMIFIDTRFFKPEAVLFAEVRLGQTSFRKSDLSKVNFRDVIWAKRPGSSKSMLCDEAEFLEWRASRLGSPQYSGISIDPPSPGLIKETYQLLKRNYDNKPDYVAADDFHYGELEMKRLADISNSKRVNEVHSLLGLVAFYKYASAYGSSYSLPATWFALTILVFAFLYPVAGLIDMHHATPVEPPFTYVQLSNKDKNGAMISLSRPTLIGHSLNTSLYIATLQKDLPFAPTYPYGRLLAVSEALMTSTFAGLFLLAVRRQFRR